MKYHEQAKIIQFYEDRYDKNGYDLNTIGWSNFESQQLRFRILADIANLKEMSICDIGCGFGDLYPYLCKRFGTINYFGVDLSKKLICEATQRYPEADFVKQNILTESMNKKFDYVLSSGTLTFKIDNHENYVYRMLEAMFNICRFGIAVNFMTSYVDYQLDKNFHLAPERAFTLAQKISRWVSVRQDYSLYEFTLYIYRQATA